ncbi:hypothetical protein M3Y97_00679100 [Aphelenchoides bicaudatus]|nr:hypothetical protein M3Y97_00679100 [Aphelenchoides bicaudatus]
MKQQKEIQTPQPPQHQTKQESDTHMEYQNLFEMCRPYINQAGSPLTPDVMMEYLRDPNKYDCVIQIFHARVAQKSYGNEKRFFCPPPCVYLYGGGWARKRDQFRQLLRTANPHLSQIQPIANMHAELQKADPRRRSNSNGWRTTYAVDKRAQELDFTNGKDYCAAKTLFISDSEKTKFFKLFVQISFMSGQEIGTFLSERIKVISKPSKKKQQIKSNECSYLCITSGKKVALFHRLRSQTVSTRYLHVADQQFRASSSKWGAFTIHLVDEEKSPIDSSDFHTKDGYIYYGAVVKLVDTNSGISLPRLRIRKVGNSNLITDVLTLDEPVSQLHKCAFQFMDDKTLYLSLVGDQIAQHSAEIVNGNQHQVSEGMAWTIISTEKVEYRFYEAMGSTWQPVTPAPIVENITFDSDASSTNVYDPTLTLSLRGRNFNPDLKIWFATHQCKTTYRSAELLDCDVPKLEHVLKYPGVLDVCEVQRDSIEVPIFLVRDDGVIYSTCMTFTYMCAQSKLQ